MTNHNEVQNAPSVLTDEEIMSIGTFGQSPLKRLDHGRAIEQAVIAKYATQPLTVSLSPDPRGVHVAVHQGSECVHAEAMVLPGAVGQRVPDDLRAGVLSEILVFSGKRPEEGETWESWYEAAFDMLLVKIKAMLAASRTTPAGEAGHGALINEGTIAYTEPSDEIEFEDEAHDRDNYLFAHPAQDEREAFERAIDDDAADCGETGFCDFTLDAVGRYMAPGLESAWWAWQARAAVLADREGRWLPIETAPQNGRTLLLGYFNSHQNWRTVRGQWMSEEYFAESWEDPDDVDPGWFETSVEADDLPNCWRIRPTHWQPLPAPPAAAQRAKEPT